jgi:dUTP pyrophosphatase
MKVELINYGGKIPVRQHANDAGADVYASETRAIMNGCTERIRIGIGVNIPSGYVVQIVPRSGLASKGIFCITGTIDSGYTGEISATMANVSGQRYVVNEGDRIAQLVMYPIALPEYTFDEDGNKRGCDGFGSSGR